MANNTITLGTTGYTGLLLEATTGVHGLLHGALGAGISSGSSGVINAIYTAQGAAHVEVQGSTEALGQVGGHTVLVNVNLAPTTSQAYTAGDLMGSAALELSSVFRSTSVMTGLLQSIRLGDLTTQQGAFDFLLLDTATTGTTYTNDSAFDLGDGDIAKTLGHVELIESDYSAFNDNGIATVRNIGLPVQATTGTSLFVVSIVRSAPTYVTTGDLKAKFGFLVD